MQESQQATQVWMKPSATEDIQWLVSIFRSIPGTLTLNKGTLYLYYPFVLYSQLAYKQMPVLKGKSGPVLQKFLQRREGTLMPPASRLLHCSTAYTVCRWHQGSHPFNTWLSVSLSPFLFPPSVLSPSSILIGGNRYTKEVKGGIGGNHITGPFASVNTWWLPVIVAQNVLWHHFRASQNHPGGGKGSIPSPPPEWIQTLYGSGLCEAGLQGRYRIFQHFLVLGNAEIS